MPLLLHPCIYPYCHTLVYTFVVAPLQILVLLHRCRYSCWFIFVYNISCYTHVDTLCCYTRPCRYPLLLHPCRYLCCYTLLDALVFTYFYIPLLLHPCRYPEMRLKVLKPWSETRKRFYLKKIEILPKPNQMKTMQK